MFGGALVMATFDVSFVQFYNQLLGAVDAGDFVLGIVKAAVFGLTIAGDRLPARTCHRRRRDFGRPVGDQRGGHEHRLDRGDRRHFRRAHELRSPMLQTPNPLG